jgi:hypothetical protein
VVLHISKLDAVRRQLETAVVLYFHEDDPVSIHTLTCAGYEILRGVTRARKGRRMMKDWARDYLVPKFREKFGRKLNEAENFFKHSGPNPEGTLPFDSSRTEVLLLDACWAYRSLTGERLPLLGVFDTWAALTFAREWVKDVGVETLHAEFLHRLSSKNRQEFFEDFVSTAYRATVWTGR